jgi:hypothetical protein
MAFLLAAPTLQGETFKNPRLISTGTDPVTVSEGDFNGDGKPDLAYLDGTSTRVLHVLLGNGDASFRFGQDISLPFGVGGMITVADVNKDGRLDLIIGGNNPQGQIAVFLGNGDGTFGTIILSQFPAAGSNYATLFSKFGVADVNGDGAVDLIAGDSLNPAVYVLLGNNTGSFTLKSSIFNGSGPSTVLTGDFNGDGHQDFLVHGALGADATVYLGNGNGTFQTGVRYKGPHNIGSVLLVDMDGDGHPDMVVSGFSNTIDILHGNADGTFASTSSGGASYGGVNPALVAVADLNGDGILDIVTVTSNGASVLLGTGNLSYKAPIPYSAGPSGVVVTGDFNGDGRIDFVGPAPGGLALLLSNADGTLQSADSYDVGEAVNSVAVGNFNSDSFPDIAVSVAAPLPRILLGLGGGKFAITPDPNQAGGAGLGSAITTGDFNGDGKTDLFLGGDNVSGNVFFGTGNGTFGPALSVGSFQVAGFSRDSVADLNKDGKSDLVLTNYQELDVLLGQANQSFKFLSSFQSGLQGSVNTSIADFNKDGTPDVVFSGTTTLQILLGKGDGTFTTGRLLQTELPNYSNLNAPQAIATADLDGDGNIDIVAVISFPGLAEIFYGKGDGTFEDPVALVLTRPYSQISIADMNGDGKRDLVLSDGTLLSVVHNNGKRAFGPEVHFLGGAIGTFVVKDLNGDGLPDIVVSNIGFNNGASTVTVLLNQPGGNTVSGSLIVKPEPSTLGLPFTISLTIGPAVAGAGTPTGVVRFAVDNFPVGSAPINGTTAQITLSNTSMFALGAHSVSAAYDGDANFLSSAFSTTHNVIPVVHQTSTALSASSNHPLASKTVRFTVTVSSTGIIPRGTVGFYDGTVTLGTAVLDGNGVGIFDTALLSAGSHNIKAIFVGNSDFASSTSPVVTVVVAANPTVTTLSAVPGSVSAGAMVSLTAMVTSTAGTPTGAITFFDGLVPIATTPLDAAGNAIFGTVFSNSGAHSISAGYAANSTYAASTSAPIAFTVNDTAAANSTSTGLTVSVTVAGAPGLMLTAAVTSPRGSPSGSVIFMEGNKVLGGATLDASGITNFSTPELATGLHYLSAVYQGTPSFKPSVSSAFLVTVPTASPDFFLNLSQAAVTLGRERSSQLKVTATPVNGFKSDVRLSCDLPVRFVACSFQPAFIRSGNGTSNLVIVASPVQHASAHLNARPWTFAWILGPWCFLFLQSKRRHHCRIAVGLALLFSIGGGLGCGSQPKVSSSLPTGTYAITVTAKASNQGHSVIHSAQVVLTVGAN